MPAPPNPTNSIVVSVVMAVLSVVVWAGPVAAAQTDTEGAAPTTPALVGVIASGEGGYWLIDSRGEVEVVGQAPAPPPPVAIGELSVVSVLGSDPAGPVVLVLEDGSEVTLVASAPDAGDGDPAGGASSEPPAGALSGLIASILIEEGSDVALVPACAGRLAVGFQAGQVLMAGVPWQDLPGAVGAVSSGRLGGVVVMGRPDASVADFLTVLHSAGEVPVLVAVDEEGGRVQRLRDVIGRLPDAASQAEENTPEELRAMVADHARAMAGLGLDMDFAPVIDVGGGPGIGDRAYSDDPVLVAEYGMAFVDGLSAAGITGVVKHFPGHGRASADSHLRLPTTPPLEEMLAVDLEPFRRAIEAGVPAIMVGHLDVPGLTDGRPASLSAEAIDGLLRDQLGFDGLVITDSLDMGAVTARWSTPEAVLAALGAGADIALLGDTTELDEVHSAVVAAVESGELAPARLAEATARVLRIKGLDPCTLAL
ncbi:MAG TPA: glycoside hydrolase family 3 protein [Acidimicrobiales bacterium]|nr:glycoside hydrolase family 3 protein [Acidimicrobiales bacterium]